MSFQLTDEQMAARIRGERLSVRNDIRRRIQAAEDLATLSDLEARIGEWELEDDLELNATFERRWKDLDRAD